MKVTVYCTGFRNIEDGAAPARYVLALEPKAAGIEAAAEAAFEATNAPWSEPQYLERHGRTYCLSVGDIVVVGDEAAICASVGWVSFPAAIVPRLIERQEYELGAAHNWSMAREGVRWAEQYREFCKHPELV